MQCAEAERAGAGAERSPWDSGLAWILPAAGLTLAAFGVGLGLAWAWAHCLEPRPPDPRAPAAVWITDRDAHRVWGLDRNLLVVREVGMRAPIEVEACSDHGAWVVGALDGDPLGRHQLARLDPAGMVTARAPLGALMDLALCEQDGAVVVDLGPTGARVSEFDAGAGILWQRDWPGAACAAAAGRWVLVGGSSGGLARFDRGTPSAAPLLVAWGSSVADVAPGPTADTWWALDAGSGHRLALLGADLSARWTRATQISALHLAPVPGKEQVWLADSTLPLVRRYGSGGVQEIERSDMAQGGLDRAAALAGGGALFTTPGALLSLDAWGRNAPGQGGFDFLVDVAVGP
ncbi:MAG: hypothetical protein IPK67_13560 [Planctomycetes bacterium]|jgi:hypothetical protein|nr:hypothetical protein [Planctomycetota bacterium]